MRGRGLFARHLLYRQRRSGVPTTHSTGQAHLNVQRTGGKVHGLAALHQHLGSAVNTFR